MPDGRFPIRLVALDIDGTLIGPDLEIRERTRRAIAEASRRGITVSLATGRMASSAMRFARTLDLLGPVIAYQGGLIRAMPERGSNRVGKLLRHRPLAAAVAREAILWSRGEGLDPHINHLERFILRADDPNAEDYSTFMGSRAELVPDLLAATAHPVTKVLAVSDRPLSTSTLDAARSHFAGRADVTISHPRFLEFVAPGVSKGQAVRWLARRLGVPIERTLAIGDQFNDLEMISAVGHGAAMAGAPPAVRLAARYVAPPVDAEGAAQLIEALVLPGTRLAERNARRLEEQASAAHAVARRELGHDPRPDVPPAGLTGATEAASLDGPARRPGPGRRAGRGPRP